MLKYCEKTNTNEKTDEKTISKLIENNKKITSF